jgi:hypothetical protein
MSRILVSDCRMWDGPGVSSYPADVLIEGDRVRAIATDRGKLDHAAADMRRAPIPK